jgi:hypothetical protein
VSKTSAYARPFTWRERWNMALDRLSYDLLYKQSMRLRRRCLACKCKLPGHKFGCGLRPGRGQRYSMRGPW